MSRIIKVALLGLLLLVFVGGGLGIARLNSFSKATSGRGLTVSEIDSRAGDYGRFNLLVLGYGGEGHEGAYLTDSILVYSMSRTGGPSTQISVPRDLWIESPADSGRYGKVNAVFANTMATSDNMEDAADVAVESLSEALGIPIHGWMTVDFDGFRDLVDALGGVEVNVQRAFTARYPRNDDPSVDYRWTNIRFKKGPQAMNGERAIRYARARYSTPESEASDFARAARQQRLVAAIKSKLLSPAGIMRSFSVADAVEDDVRSNVSARDLIQIFRKGVDQKHSAVLSPENVLQADSSNDGQYILVPQGGDWTTVHAFVRDTLNTGAVS